MLGRIRAEWHFWSAGCVILLLCCAPHAFSGWQRADCFFYDALTRACPVQPPMRKIAIVAVDDISLSTIGQWPWPRYRLAALIGPSRAKMLLLAGQRIDAETALAWGLIDRIVPAEALMAQARALAADACAAETDHLMAIKAMIG